MATTQTDVERPQVSPAVLDLLQFYQRELRETPEGREALEKLEVTDPAVVDHFHLGYGTGNALRAMGEEQYQALLAQGLVFRQPRRERFAGAVVMPVYDEKDQLVDLYGLRHYSTQIKTVFWHEPPRGLIGVNVLEPCPEIILCDKPLLAMHVRQHGYENVVALRQPKELERLLPLLIKHGIQRVWLVARTHRKALVKMLEKAKIAFEAVKTSHSDGIISKERLEVIGTKPLQEAVKVKLVSRSDTRLSFRAGDVTYHVDALAAAGLGMRLQIRAEQHGRTSIDKVDLASAGARRKYSKYAGSKLGLVAADVESHLEAMADRIDSLAREAVQEQSKAPRVLTKPQRKAAMEILKGEDVLVYQADAVEKLFHFTGEEETKRLALLVAASRLLDEPLGAILRGPGSSGKSALIRAVTGILPTSSVLSFSRLTSQALYFMPRDSLKHKVLGVDEYAGLENSEYALRTMMTSQTLSLAITLREGGRVPVTRTIEIPATLAVLVSTTGAVNIENLSRFLELKLDASAAQTKKVMGAIAEARTNGVNVTKRKQALQTLRNVSALLRPCIVVCPFADKLTYPAANVLARRRFAQVIGLVCAHAALHQYQRKTHETEDGVLVVEAVKADYEAVHPLLGHIVEHFEEDVSPAAMELLEHVGAKALKRVTRKDVMDGLGWSYSKAYKTLAELTALDLLIPDALTNGVLRVYEIAPYFTTEKGITQIAPPNTL